MWQTSMITNKIYKIKLSILSDFNDGVGDSFPILSKIFDWIESPKSSKQVIPMKEYIQKTKNNDTLIVFYIF